MSSKPLTDHLAKMARRLREQQRMPYTELSDRLAKLGRPIPVLGLRRIEKGERRVDLDELVALASALGATVSHLTGIGSFTSLSDQPSGATPVSTLVQHKDVLAEVRRAVLAARREGLSLAAIKDYVDLIDIDQEGARR